jgi:hypothetical protein
MFTIFVGHMYFEKIEQSLSTKSYIFSDVVDLFLKIVQYKNADAPPPTPR